MKNKIILSSLICGASCVAASTSYAAETTEKKNILFIAVDDLKPLLGCYGDDLALTPNIDGLASKGAIFESAYCQQAISGPSRASLLTGKCPDATKVWDLKTLIRREDTDVVTLPEYFKNSGYFVTGIGKIYDPRTVDKQTDELSWSESFMNYEKYLDPVHGKPANAQYQLKETKQLIRKFTKEAKESGLVKGREIAAYVQQRIKPATESADVPDDAYADGAIAKGAIEFLNGYKGDQPFFLAVGFKKPHLPFCAPKVYWDKYKRSDMPLAEFTSQAKNSPSFVYHNSGELRSYTDIPSLESFTDAADWKVSPDKSRQLIHGYYASISYIDAQVGKVIEALQANGLDKNTIIVLWGDHGWHLGDHGLWNKHSNFEQATRVPLLIIDPSLQAKRIDQPVEFLDIYPTLCDLAGLASPTDLDGVSLKPLMKGQKQHKEYAVSQYPRGKYMGYSIRSKEFRYTVWVAWDNKQTDVSKVVARELYDYTNDPLETVNLIDSPAYTDAVNQMESYWEEYIKTRIH